MHTRDTSVTGKTANVPTPMGQGPVFVAWGPGPRNHRFICFAGLVSVLPGEARPTRPFSTEGRGQAAVLQQEV